MVNTPCQTSPYCAYSKILHNRFDNPSIITIKIIKGFCLLSKSAVYEKALRSFQLHYNGTKCIIEIFLIICYFLRDYQN